MGMNPRSFLAKEMPLLTKQWSERNKGVDIMKVGSSSNKKYWWECSLGHEWEATPNSRSGGSGCPYCTGKKVLAGFNDLTTTHPLISSQWDYSANSGIQPGEISAGSGRTFLWVCSSGHQHKSTVANKVKHVSHCPHCKNTSNITVFKNSVAHSFPELMDEWDYQKNPHRSPKTVSPSSNVEFWWICKLKHSWKSSVSKRTQRSYGCPYCSNKRVLPGFNDLNTRYPNLANEWDGDKNEISADGVFPGTTSKYWWKCAEGHSWQASPNKRTTSKRGCPFCSGQKRMIGINDLATTHPEVVKMMHPTKNQNVDPNQVGYGSNKRVRWECKEGHEWESTIKQRVTSRTDCPLCKMVGRSYVEEEFYSEILKSFPAAQSNKKINMPVSNERQWVNVDVTIESPLLKIAIEYDGSYWHQPLEVKKLDKQKSTGLLELGYIVVRFRENNLAFLNIEDENHHEIRYNYKSSVSDAVDKMRELLCLGSSH